MICDATSKSAAAISVVFIIANTPWAVQQVITSCTRTIVSDIKIGFVNGKKNCVFNSDLSVTRLNFVSSIESRTNQN